MQLTRFTDLALRVMMFVARADGRVCTVAEIAAFYPVSHEHLRKVVHKLGRLGYLTSSRGRNGGVILARSAGSIPLGQLILEIEEDLSIVDCKGIGCRLSAACALKSQLNRGARAFVAALNEVSLADVLGDRRMKQQFSSIHADRKPRARPPRKKTTS